MTTSSSCPHCLKLAHEGLCLPDIIRVSESDMDKLISENLIGLGWVDHGMSRFVSPSGREWPERCQSPTNSQENGTKT